ncbi:MAG TPA: nicotinate (nicotinamide) nucleotide adenylyltransferase [Verrucomicrobiae bacterium]
MRIGLYGGSFDPVHIGHLLVAQAAHEEVGLDRIYFIPAAQSPFKLNRILTPDHLRLQMLRRALAGVTYAEVDSQELDRGGISYSIETVRSYAAQFSSAELFYLIGADHVAQLPKWREARELAERVTFLIIPRPGEPAAKPVPPFRSQQLAGFPIGLSASQIRERVRQKLPVELLVGAPVAETIRHNDLYLS